MEGTVVLLLSLAIDLILREYPSFIHPVVWIGKVISLELRFVPERGQHAQLIYGSVIVISTVTLFALPRGTILPHLAHCTPPSRPDLDPVLPPDLLFLVINNSPC